MVEARGVGDTRTMNVLLIAKTTDTLEPILLGFSGMWGPSGPHGAAALLPASPSGPADPAALYVHSHMTPE